MKLTKTAFKEKLRNEFFNIFESKYEGGEVELGEGGRWNLYAKGFEFIEFSPTNEDFNTGYIRRSGPTEKDTENYGKNRQHEKDLLELWKKTKEDLKDEYFQSIKTEVMDGMSYDEDDMEEDDVENEVNEIARGIMLSKLGL